MNIGNANGNLFWRILRRLVPFFNELKPTGEDCAQTDQGGRWDKANSTDTLTDQIGDEVRMLRPDMAIKGDGTATIDMRAMNGNYYFMYGADGLVIEEGVIPNSTQLIPSYEVAFIKVYDDSSKTTLVADYGIQEEANVILFDRLGNTHQALISDASIWTTTCYAPELMNISNSCNWFYDYTLEIFVPEDLNNRGYDVTGRELKGGSRTKYNAHKDESGGYDFGYNVTQAVDEDKNWWIDPDLNEIILMEI